MPGTENAKTPRGKEHEGRRKLGGGRIGLSTSLLGVFAPLHLGASAAAELGNAKSGEDALHDVGFFDAGEFDVEAAEGVGEALVVDAEEWSIVACRSRRWTGFSAML